MTAIANVAEGRSGSTARGLAFALTRRYSAGTLRRGHPDDRRQFSDPALLLPTTSRLRRSRRLWRVLAFVALAVAVLALVAARFALPDATLGDRIARVEIAARSRPMPDGSKRSKRSVTTPR